jgi:hypothetical protein
MIGNSNMDKIMSKVKAMTYKIYPTPPALEDIFIVYIGADWPMIKEVK